MNWIWKKDKEALTTLYYQGRTYTYSRNQSLKPKYCSTDRQPYLSNAEEIKLSLQQSYNTRGSKKASAGYYQLTASRPQGNKHTSQDKYTFGRF